MDNLSASRARRLRPSLSLLLAATAAVGAVGGCSSQPSNADPSGTMVPSFGVGPTSGSAATGGSSQSVGGPVMGSGGSTGSMSTSEGSASNAGLGLDTGPVNSGGAPVSTTGTGGGAAEPPPCEDAPPPFDPNWPEATCESWAFEAAACGEAWFANYCDVSCGRCTPADGSGGPPMPPDCSGENLPNVTGGAGFATRYWDCCQPSCAQNDGHKCNQDGVTQTGDNSSACAGGGAFACYDDAPRAVSNCLSYGHIAKANPNCGGCFRIQFTGTGKQQAERHWLQADPGQTDDRQGDQHRQRRGWQSVRPHDSRRRRRHVQRLHQAMGPQRSRAINSEVSFPIARWVRTPTRRNVSVKSA